eukprot:14440455-Alexandrium_andersonii.AAC.1
MPSAPRHQEIVDDAGLIDLETKSRAGLKGMVPPAQATAFELPGRPGRATQLHHFERGLPGLAATNHEQCPNASSLAGHTSRHLPQQRLEHGIVVRRSRAHGAINTLDAIPFMRMRTGLVNNRAARSASRGPNRAAGSASRGLRRPARGGNTRRCARRPQGRLRCRRAQ